MNEKFPDIEEEEIVSVLKRTLSEALPLTNAPGPSEVSAEEGFSGMSLLYFDTMGELYSKEQQNQPMLWDGDSVTIGPTNGEHIALSASTISFKNDTTVMASLTGNTWVLGQTGTGNQNIEITNSGINLRSDETDFAEFGLTTAAPFLKFTDAGSGNFWELKKDYNDNNFTVKPETDSIFKFMPSAGAAVTLGIDTTDTNFNGASKTSNAIVTQNMGRTSGMSVNSVMGGAVETYADGALIDLFGFTMANGQLMYCDLTIVSWSPTTTAEVQGVSRFRIIVYRGNTGTTVYPTVTGIGNQQVRQLEEWQEFSAMDSDTVLVAAGGGSDEYKVTLDRDYAGTITSATRLVYKADIIGTVTAITNLQL